MEGSAELQSRRRIFSDIFGVDRPVSPTPNYLPINIPNRLEDLSEQVLMTDTVDHDLKRTINSKTHIRRVSDSLSFSSQEDQNSPIHSPTKSHQYLQDSHINGYGTSPLGIQNVNVPRSTPTLASLSMSQLPKLKHNQVVGPNSSSKKSPLQNLGFFSRPNSKDLEQESHNHQYAQSCQSNESILSRTSSIGSTTFKNLTFQQKQKSLNGRHIPQKYTPVLNHLGELHQQNKQSVGLNLRSRHSSASLNSNSQNQQTKSSNSSHHRKSSISLYSKSIITSSPMKKPQVYPAMLSRVATIFKKYIQLGEHEKDGLLYRDAFTGQQAVDIICSIIRTSDRNLALLLGRALDAQKLFHDVVYEHRLRDSLNEIYEFTNNSRFIGNGPPSGYEIGVGQMDSLSIPGSSASSILVHQSNYSMNSYSNLPVSSDGKNIHRIMDSIFYHNVNGVFTLLAECYSPTCTRDRLCYSISCPRRLEQQARLNLKPDGGLKRNISVAIDDEEEEKPSWTSSVPEDVWSSLPKNEVKRQEAIYEVYITEKNFVKSLEVLRDTFMKTLAETNIIPSDIRKNFIKHVFAHVNDIYSVNRRFLDALSDRQKSSPIVDGIGDILLKFIPFFEPFVMYVASRPYAKYLIETQRSVNPYFARFDDDLMNSPLRHGIDSFLSQGVSRPGRYVLLVREIMKSSNSEKYKRDLENLTRALEALRDFMKRIDKASGAAQDRHDVKLLRQKILFKNEYVNMGLNDEKRKIRHEGMLSRKELNKSDGITTGDIQYYLLDNMLLFLKAKPVNKWNQHKVFQRALPLPLLFVYPGEDMPPLKKYIGCRPDAAGMVIPSESTTVPNSKNALTFYYYGAKQRFQVTLFAAQYASMQTLLDKIKEQQANLISLCDIFNINKISDRYFDYSNKINSVTTCDGGRKLLIATNQGLYVSDIRRGQDSQAKKSTTSFSTPIKILHRSNITQVSVMEAFQSILLLADKKLYSCHMDLLKQGDNGTQYFKKHAKELVNHVSFFAEGDSNSKRLVVTAHSSSHSIKYFEHDHPMLLEGKKNLKRKITEVVFDSEPVSISFLKTNLCIGCKKGFQIISIIQNAHESLLDPADTSLEFALKDTLRPMAIYRVGSVFLLCYSEFAFFVNNQGWRKKESHIIHWEGEPEKFAIWYPYILAFDNNFIEIRKIDTGELVRCILGEKIRLLQTSSQEILYVYEDERGYDTVASLDLWG